MWNLPNFLSLVRIPLAFFFLSEAFYMRMGALCLGFLSDVLDGYLARRYRQSSSIGAILDPISDKFFMGFVIAVFSWENRFSVFEIFSMISRDIAVASYGLYLILKGRLKGYEVRAIWCGKVTTALQFVLLMALLCGFRVDFSFFVSLLCLGVLALGELYLSDLERY